MDTKRTDVVSASEIASWEWCPEAWRLEALGAEPGNQESLDRGEAFHTRTAAAEVWSRRAAALGRWLLVLAVLVALLWYVLFGEAG